LTTLIVLSSTPFFLASGVSMRCVADPAGTPSDFPSISFSVLMRLLAFVIRAKGERL